MIPSVTALYAAVNAILNVLLANQVSTLRRREKIGIGTGESKTMLLAVRAHANNAEFVPLALVMLLIVELCRGASLGLHVAGGLLFVGRVLHIVGLPRRAPNPFRVTGTVLTWGVILALSGWALWLRRG